MFALNTSALNTFTKNTFAPNIPFLFSSDINKLIPGLHSLHVHVMFEQQLIPPIIVIPERAYSAHMPSTPPIHVHASDLPQCASICRRGVCISRTCSKYTKTNTHIRTHVLVLAPRALWNARQTAMLFGIQSHTHTARGSATGRDTNVTNDIITFVASNLRTNERARARARL